MNYEGARLRIGQLVQGNVPTASFRARSPQVYQSFLSRVPAVTDPIYTNGVGNPDTGLHRRNDAFIDDENLFNVRGDYNSGRMSTFLRYSQNRTESSAPYLLPDARRKWDANNQLATLNNTFIVNPAQLNEFRLGFNRWYLPRKTESYDTGVGEIGITGVLPGGYNNEGLLRWVSNVYSANDNYTWRKGAHALKFGGELRWLVSGRIQRQNPVYTYNSANDFLNNIPLRVQVTFGNPGADMRQWQTGVYFQDEWRVKPQLTLNLGLRYEYYQPFRGYGVLFNVQGDQFGPFAPAGAEIYKKDLNNFQPRIGFAWDATGKQSTVIRGGAGIYNSPLAPWGLWNMATIDPALPFGSTYTRTDIPDLAYPISGRLRLAVEAPELAARLGLLPPTVSRRTVDTNLRDTYNILANLTIEQRLSANWKLQTNFVTSNTRKSYMTRTLNFPDPSLGGSRPVPSIGDINVTENAGRRDYNALQVSVLGRSWRGLTTDVHYTWGHTLIYGNDDCCSGGGDIIQDQDNVAGSRGNSNSDVRHQLTFSYSYEFPFSSHNKSVNEVIGGWAIQGITKIRSGLPINILSGRDTRGNSYAATQRPNVVKASIYPATQTIYQWLDRTAFAFPAQGQFGNAGFNIGRGPNSYNFDISIQKRFQIREHEELQFRTDLFNAFNHANFGIPVNTLTNPNFGVIQTAADPRVIQLSLRFLF